MNVDEMDLVRQALDVTPWHPEAYERARTVLRAAMAESGPRPEAAPVPAVAPVRGRGFTRARNRRRGTLGPRGKVGIGAGVAAVAAAAAVVLATTPGPQPAAPARPASQAPAATSKLVTLAALIKASDTGPLPGNASLVIANMTNGGKLLQVVYDLYTDSGAMYTAEDKNALITAVDQNANVAWSSISRELAAARYAAAGDLATARVQMVDAAPNCWGIGLSAAAKEKIWAQCAVGLREKGMKTPPKQPTGQALQDDIDNNIWFGCRDALSWVGADPQIREGVLRLLSTIPAVTVANSTTDGQPTLTITAEPALFGNGSDQVLTVNARTGLPISFVQSHGESTDVETDQVSRVTLADIKAGKF